MSNFNRLTRLWAPWRYAYVTSISRRKGCFLCDAIKIESTKPEESLVVHKTTYTIVVLNRYPYNPGHLLIAPVRHVADLEDLNEKELSDLIENIVLSKIVIKKIYNPDGFNIGLNLGKVAGAGLEEHLHFHIVPRWSGDTNFMVTLASTKVIVEALEQSYLRIREGFKKFSKFKD